jgi:molybdopterin/thiamine biosynthesis adenylyltransferase
LEDREVWELLGRALAGRRAAEMPYNTNLHNAAPDIEEYAKPSARKVLLVGAGGIGCELLKTLIHSGFGEIHVVCI